MFFLARVLSVVYSLLVLNDMNFSSSFFMRYFVLMSKNINFPKQQATITIYQRTHITIYMSIAQMCNVLHAQIRFQNLVGFVH